MRIRRRDRDVFQSGPTPPSSPSEHEGPSSTDPVRSVVVEPPAHQGETSGPRPSRVEELQGSPSSASSDGPEEPWDQEVHAASEPPAPAPVVQSSEKVETANSGGGPVESSPDEPSGPV